MKTAYIPIMSEQHHGSWMPIDTDVHWDWRNPFNLLLVLPLLLLVIALI